VAGTVVSAAVITGLPPMVKWTAVIIAGGSASGRDIFRNRKFLAAH